MALNLEYLDAAGNAAADGVFIPIADLPGVTAAELAAGQSATTKESKAIYALLNQIFSVVSPAGFSKLGFALTRGNPTGAGDNIFNQAFTHTWQKLVDLSAGLVDVVPVPTSGVNSGIGDFGIVDVFPNAAKVAAAGAVAGAGIVVPTADLSAYSDLVHADLSVVAGADEREWFNALSDAIAGSASVRSATVSSAITTATNGTMGSLAIPAAYTATTDPTSGILAANVPHLGLIQRTNTIVVQSVLNQSTQTFDVNVASL